MDLRDTIDRQLVALSSAADGGATNNNPGSFPQVGDYNGLLFNTGSTASVLNDVTVFYAGHDQPGAIVDDDAGLTMTNSVLSNSSVGGLRIVDRERVRCRVRNIRAIPAPLVAQRLRAARNYCERGGRAGVHGLWRGRRDD